MKLKIEIESDAPLMTYGALRVLYRFIERLASFNAHANRPLIGAYGVAEIPVGFADADETVTVSWKCED